MAKVTQADEIRNLDLHLKVYEGIIAGKSIRALSEELGIRTSAVRDLMRDVGNTMMDGYHEQLEWTRARTFARLEGMYRIAAARATGTALPTDSKDDKGKSPWEGVPDRHWMKMAVDILKAQVDLMSADEQWVKQREAENKAQLDARTVETITITRTSEMYKHAHEAEWQSWADTNLEHYLSNDDEPEAIEVDLQTINKELKEMEHSLGEYPDELDEDEE